MSQSASNCTYLPTSQESLQCAEGEHLFHTLRSAKTCPSNTPSACLSGEPAASIPTVANPLLHSTRLSKVPPALPLPSKWSPTLACHPAPNRMLGSLNAICSGYPNGRKSARLPHFDAAASPFVSSSLSCEAPLPCAVHTPPTEACYVMRTAAAEQTLERLQRENDALKRKYIEFASHRQQLENTIDCLKEELTLMGRTVLRQSVTLRKLPPSLVRCSPRQMLRQRREGAAVSSHSAVDRQDVSRLLAEEAMTFSGNTSTPLASPSTDASRPFLPTSRSAIGMGGSRGTAGEEEEAGAANGIVVEMEGVRFPRSKKDRSTPLSPREARGRERVGDIIDHQSEEADEWKRLALALDALLPFVPEYPTTTVEKKDKRTTQKQKQEEKQTYPPKDVPHTTRMGKHVCHEGGSSAFRSLAMASRGMPLPPPGRGPLVFQISIRVLYAEVYRLLLPGWPHENDGLPTTTTTTTTTPSSSIADHPARLGEWDGCWIRLVGPSGETLLQTLPEPLDPEEREARKKRSHTKRRKTAAKRTGHPLSTSLSAASYQTGDDGSVLLAAGPWEVGRLRTLYDTTWHITFQLIGCKMACVPLPGERGGGGGGGVMLLLPGERPRRVQDVRRGGDHLKGNDHTEEEERTSDRTPSCAILATSRVPVQALLRTSLSRARAAGEKARGRRPHATRHHRHRSSSSYSYSSSSSSADMSFSSGWTVHTTTLKAVPSSWEAAAATSTGGEVEAHDFHPPTDRGAGVREAPKVSPLLSPLPPSHQTETDALAKTTAMAAGTVYFDVQSTPFPVCPLTGKDGCEWSPAAWSSLRSGSPAPPHRKKRNGGCGAGKRRTCEEDEEEEDESIADASFSDHTEEEKTASTREREDSRDTEAEDTERSASLSSSMSWYRDLSSSREEEEEEEEEKEKGQRRQDGKRNATAPHEEDTHPGRWRGGRSDPPPHSSRHRSSRLSSSSWSCTSLPACHGYCAVVERPPPGTSLLQQWWGAASPLPSSSSSPSSVWALPWTGSTPSSPSPPPPWWSEGVFIQLLSAQSLLQRYARPSRGPPTTRHSHATHGMPSNAKRKSARRGNREGNALRPYVEVWEEVWWTEEKTISDPRLPPSTTPEKEEPKAARQREAPQSTTGHPTATAKSPPPERRYRLLFTSPIPQAMSDADYRWAESSSPLTAYDESTTTTSDDEEDEAAPAYFLYRTEHAIGQVVFRVYDHVTVGTRPAHPTKTKKDRRQPYHHAHRTSLSEEKENGTQRAPHPLPRRASCRSKKVVPSASRPVLLGEGRVPLASLFGVYDATSPTAAPYVSQRALKLHPPLFSFPPPVQKKAFHHHHRRVASPFSPSSRPSPRHTQDECTRSPRRHFTTHFSDHLGSLHIAVVPLPSTKEWPMGQETAATAAEVVAPLRSVEKKETRLSLDIAVSAGVPSPCHAAASPAARQDGVAEEDTSRSSSISTHSHLSSTTRSGTSTVASPPCGASSSSPPLPSSSALISPPCGEASLRIYVKSGDHLLSREDHLDGLDDCDPRVVVWVEEQPIFTVVPVHQSSHPRWSPQVGECCVQVRREQEIRFEVQDVTEYGDVGLIGDSWIPSTAVLEKLKASTSAAEEVVLPVVRNGLPNGTLRIQFSVDVQS